MSSLCSVTVDTAVTHVGKCYCLCLFVGKLEISFRQALHRQKLLYAFQLNDKYHVVDSEGVSIAGVQEVQQEFSTTATTYLLTFT